MPDLLEPKIDWTDDVEMDLLSDDIDDLCNLRRKMPQSNYTRGQTHWGIIRSSQRFVRIRRLGRLLMVLGNRDSVSTCRYDDRFKLMPKGWTP